MDYWRLPTSIGEMQEPCQSLAMCSCDLSIGVDKDSRTPSGGCSERGGALELAKTQGNWLRRDRRVLGVVLLSPPGLVDPWRNRDPSRLLGRGTTECMSAVDVRMIYEYLHQSSGNRFK